jgi:hypothetical protein
VLWAAVSISGWLLTLLPVRRYRQAADGYISFEGSMEWIAAFQKDVEGLRLVRPRLRNGLALSVLSLVLIQRLAVG